MQVLHAFDIMREESGVSWDILFESTKEKHLSAMTCTVLALESSCDETAVSILQRNNGLYRVLSEKIHSQIAQHAEHGGVVPEIAARAHLNHFPSLINECLNESHIRPQDCDAFACTTGPGLVGGLLVGSMLTRTLAFRHKIPFYGIHHLEGHILSPRLEAKRPSFPYLVLLASGGHTLICIAEAVGKYRLLGRSRDDALGEAFDKSAMIMGLSYPGGPILEKLAPHGDVARFSLPSPLIGSRERADRLGCDFSFSGLKTAVMRLWINLPHLSTAQKQQAQRDMAAAFHCAVAKILANRLENAIRLFRSRFSSRETLPVVFVGGVAANALLRSALQNLCDKSGAKLSTVPLSLCTDNATMIAWASMERMEANLAPDSSHYRVRPRWSLEP